MNKGFTLIELMIVIAIIAISSLFVTRAYINMKNNIQNAETTINLDKTDDNKKFQGNY